jgi:hypothetical protein
MGFSWADRNIIGPNWVGFDFNFNVRRVNMDVPEISCFCFLSVTMDRAHANDSKRDEM